MAPESARVPVPSMLTPPVPEMIRVMVVLPPPATSSVKVDRARVPVVRLRVLPVSAWMRALLCSVKLPVRLLVPAVASTAPALPTPLPFKLTVLVRLLVTPRFVTCRLAPLATVTVLEPSAPTADTLMIPALRAVGPE